MKMAAASVREQEDALKFVNELDQNIRQMDNEALGKWVKRNMPPMQRVVFGYQVIFQNACDPLADTLEFKPEIQKAMEFYEAHCKSLIAANPLNASIVNPKS